MEESSKKMNNLLDLKKFFENLTFECEDLEEKRRIQSEIHVLNAAISDLKWEMLSDIEKQKERINRLRIMKRWDSEDGTSSNCSYEERIVSLYESIDNAIDSVVFLNSNVKIKRVFSLLLIEKYFINQYRSPSAIKHVDYYVFVDLLKEMVEVKSLLAVMNEFTSMYTVWEKRPYKEIS